MMIKVWLWLGSWVTEEPKEVVEAVVHSALHHCWVTGRSDSPTARRSDSPTLRSLSSRLARPSRSVVRRSACWTSPTSWKVPSVCALGSLPRCTHTETPTHTHTHNRAIISDQSSRPTWQSESVSHEIKSNLWRNESFRFTLFELFSSFLTLEHTSSSSKSSHLHYTVPLAQRGYCAPLEKYASVIQFVDTFEKESRRREKGEFLWSLIASFPVKAQWNTFDVSFVLCKCVAGLIVIALIIFWLAVQ